jgi:hypothetical protein
MIRHPLYSLDKVSMDDSGATAIGEALQHNHKLEILQCVLYWAAPSAGGGFLTARQILPFYFILLRPFRRLNNNRIGDDGLTAIGEGLKHNSALEMLEWVFVFLVEF